MANSERAIANIFIGLLGVSCLWNGVEADEKTAKLGGFLGATAAIVLLSRRGSETTKADYLSGVASVAEDLWDGLSDLPFATAVKQRVLEVSKVPEAFIPAVEAQITAMKGTDWLTDWSHRSRLVLGGSGSGKTTFMLSEVSRALDSGYYDLIICDLDFGSAHEGSKPNNWLGLPKEHYIRYRLSDIYQAVVDLSDLANHRASEQAEGRSVDLTWKTLILDEFPSVRREVEATMGKEALQSFDNALRNLLSRGLKQRINFIAGSQNPNVADTGIKISDLNQTNILFLGGFATDSRILQTYGCGGDGSDIAAKAKTMKAHGRVAVVKLDTGVKAVLVPHFDPSAVVLSLPEELTLTEGDRWLQGNRDQLETLMKADPELSRTKLANAVGIPTRNGDPRYEALKSFHTNYGA